MKSAEDSFIKLASSLLLLVTSLASLFDILDSFFSVNFWCE